MIYSNNLFEVLRSMIEHKRPTKRSSHFSKKKLLVGQMDNLIKLPQIYGTSYFRINSIDICDMLTNMMGCNKQVNVIFNFAKIFPFGENWQFGPNLAQDFTTLHYKMIYIVFWRVFWDILSWQGTINIQK